MKKYNAKIKLVVLLTALVISVFALSSCNTANSEKEEENTKETQEVKTEDIKIEGADSKSMMTVKGNADLNIKPSIAYLNMGVVSNSEDVKEAQKENAKKIEEVKNVLLEKGIKEEDIRSSNFYINTNYDHETYTKITGYTIYHDLTVTVREMDRAGEIMDAAIDKGANNSNNISFGITDEEREVIYIQAMTKASEKAKTKASRLAESMGFKLKGPIQIIEGDINFNGPRGYDMATDEMKYESASLSTEFMPGELKVGATVTLIYEY